MARQVQSAHEFTFKQSKWSLEKDYLVIRCDDGAIYEWERPVDGPDEFNFICRRQPNGELSTSNGRLPSAVKDTADAMLDRWTK